MASVGIRELRQHTSAVVRRAEQGERIDVTVQGRVVAALVPLSDAGRRRIALAEFAATLDRDDQVRAAAWVREVDAARDEDAPVDPVALSTITV